MKDLSKYRGCLIGGAAGDALGYPVEFLGEDAIFHRYGRRGIREYSLYKGVAQISDDTQMTLFTAAGLLRAATCGAGQVPLDIRYIWQSYQDWLRTQTEQSFREQGPRDSWLAGVPALWSDRAPGSTCLGAMMGGKMGTIEAPVNHSRGCGGVMRVAPVGIYLPGLGGLSQDDVDMFGARAAALTHGGDLAYMPAAVLVHMVSLLAHAGAAPLDAAEDAIAAAQRLFADKPHIGPFTALMERAVSLAREGADDLKAIHALGEGWVGDEALAIAVFCAGKYSEDFEKALATAVNHKGDSDSTGAITGNILGAYLGLDAIPQKFITDLELRDVILEVADDLFRDIREVLDAGTGRVTDSVWEEKYVRMTYRGRHG